MEPVKLGLLGLGTVGSGTVNMFHRAGVEIERRAGRQIVVSRAAAQDLSKPRDCDTRDIDLTDDPMSIINDPEIEVIVELIGGYEDARDLVLAAIRQGKHVITANKAMIAKYGNEIFAEAEKHGVTVAFEAAVAGGIPIVKAIRESLVGNHIQWLAGIVNGTTNYILTQMRDEGWDFQTALDEAQRLGYAEADPTFDVEGIDAAHKLTILASIAFGVPLQFDKVYTEGIAGIGREDIQYAEELGYSIKHLAIAQMAEDGIELRVHPTLVPHRRLMANVGGVMNAVMVYGDAVGRTMYYGAGAGSEPTASAVMGDILDVVRSLSAGPHNRVPYLGFHLGALSSVPVLPMEAIETAYYLRMEVLDSPGVMAAVTQILAELNISIEALLQKVPEPEQDTVPIIMLTHRIRERQMNEALYRIGQLEAVQGKIVRIRLEYFDE